MIHLCYSNRTEELLAALVQNVRQERAARSPFEPVRLVVPNRGVETYVKIGLAEALGIAANLEVTFLRRLLARAAEAALPNTRLVDLPELEGLLLDRLHDPDFMASPALSPVREYLAPAAHSLDALDRRRCQLAAELARLYDEYATSRPEMLAAWRERPTLAEHPSYGDTEVWQRTLWLALFGAEGSIARRSATGGVRLMILPELVAAAAAQGLATLALGPTLHVFGVSYIARAYHRMLAALGRGLDVRVYTLNPCREFWEDLETVAEARRRGKKDPRARLFPTRGEARQLGLAVDDDPLGLALESDNLALRLWGRPGRENIRLLNQLTDGDFDARFVAAAHAGRATTLLGRLQDDVLDRVARAEPDPLLRADGSVTVIPCPGVRREWEVVAAEIWRLLRADPTLRLSDVAVLVPERNKDEYLCHVGAVFGGCHDLPHNVIDLPLGGGHKLGEAALLLLDLPLAGFSRKALLPLITHPSLMARFAEASPSAWLHLCDELGIVHGADRGDHEGTYITRDLYSWDQGLRRLALGTLMTGPRAGDESPVVFDGQAYLPADRSPGEQETALAFGLLVRSLLEDARFAAGVTGPRVRPFTEWLEFIRGLLVGYLVPTNEAEEAIAGRCLGVIEELESVPIERPISYRVAADLVRRSFKVIAGSHGQYLAHGVTVASFVPMRAIPFRAVFVLGLGQGHFPSSVRRGPLDLRGARRAVGDVSAREQDLYMFLETLLCARDRIVLSYVARDELTGDHLAPSSVVLELREWLAQYLVADELAKVEVTAPPLRRFDDKERLEALPLAHREHVAKALGQSLREALPADVAPPDLATLRRVLPAETFTVLATRLSVHAPPERPSARAEAQRLVLPLVAIRQFLEDPLQGSARFRLRLREVEEEAVLVDREDEPFESDRVGRTRFLREVMLRALAAPGRIAGSEALMSSYDDLALVEELRGLAPTGLFRDGERSAHQIVLEGWRQQVEEIADGRPLMHQVVRFGRAAEHDEAQEIREPIVLEIEAPLGGTGQMRRLRVEIVGRTELIIDAQTDAAGSLVFVTRNRDDASKRHKDRLRAFIDHVALSAAASASKAHQALIACSTRSKRWLDRARFRPLQPERARGFLSEMVRDMLAGTCDRQGRPTGVHAYLLPCEAVFATRDKGRDLVEEIESLRDRHFESSSDTFSSVLGPVPEAAERHDPPPLEQAQAMAARRFGLYFELLETPPRTERR